MWQMWNCGCIELGQKYKRTDDNNEMIENCFRKISKFLNVIFVA